MGVGGFEQNAPELSQVPAVRKPIEGKGIMLHEIFAKLFRKMLKNFRSRGRDSLNSVQRGTKRTSLYLMLDTGVRKYYTPSSQTLHG